MCVCRLCEWRREMNRVGMYVCRLCESKRKRDRVGVFVYPM